MNRRRIRILEDAFKLWICSISLHVAMVNCSEKCLNVKEILPKKYLHIDGRSLNITLEMSNRPTHQLTTYIFKILLEEVLNYPNVEIFPHEDYLGENDVVNTINRLSGPTSESNYTIPRTMINLEVWVPVEYDPTLLLNIRYVRDCGTIAPPGKFGWFIPKINLKSLSTYVNWVDKVEDVHWSLFRLANFSSMFDIKNENCTALIKKLAFDHTNKRYFCSENYCNEGIYTPPQCQGNTNCALLLAPNFNSTSFVKEHIDELKLLVKVVWLDYNLKSVIKKIVQIYSSLRIRTNNIIFISWTPSEIILKENNFISVTFKHCDLSDFSLNVSTCKYEMMKLIKYSWSQLDKYAPQVMKLLQKYTFQEEEFKSLMNFYEKNENSSISSIACNWLKANMNLWKYHWGTTNIKKHEIYIGGIFPLTKSSYSGKGILEGAMMAVNAINNNSSLLENFKLKLLINNGQCSADWVLRAFIDYIKNNYYDNLVGVLGPACSETVEPLAGVSKHYNSLVISYSAEGASFSDREKYPYFFRTIGENKEYKDVYLQLFKKLQWKRIATLTEDGQKYTEYLSHTQDLLEKNGINFIATTKFPRERETSAMTRYLEDLKRKRARIIIADVYDDVARSVMCEAYKLDMTAKNGYVWFLPEWLNKTWFDTSYFNKNFNESVTCSKEEMIKVINGHFSLTPLYFASNDSIMEENITVSKWREKYDRQCMLKGIEKSNYAGFSYDAVWTYALALDKIVKHNPEALFSLHSKNTTEKLVQNIQNTNFDGVSGRINFYGGPSRKTVINLVQWYETKTSVVGRYEPNTENNFQNGQGILNLNKSSIVWLTVSGLKPDDGSLPEVTCTLNGLAKLLKVECDTAIIVLNIFVFSILIAVVASILLIMKRKYENKVERTQQYMKSLGIDLIFPPDGELDKWEMPREAIVINRKLGEGAFGTVYGGEANFLDKGWLPVAVKTLKKGSSTEEKVDFLSEAEVMKRFDHKNIVKLLGVCTKSEPVYTIMEFMLFGDLKTYLLARRHLVNNSLSTEESEEISRKKLTCMALDVARGLSYLAKLKYVHRDIASRNCLVNVQRIVKIGDFGMTRPLFENDYYRFSRKGMLPVRWMAPESLSLGIFTPASDVWSYGVLLYEIITFGSFPFQGLSNNEVLEAVKRGSTLNVPRGVHFQTEGLLKSCWKQDPKLRPQASEIVEFLANNPRIISPCLDVPASSVNIEEKNQFEVKLHETSQNINPVDDRKNDNINLKDFEFLDDHGNNFDNKNNLHLRESNPEEPLLGNKFDNSLQHSIIKHNDVSEWENRKSNDYYAVTEV